MTIVTVYFGEEASSEVFPVTIFTDEAVAFITAYDRFYPAAKIWTPLLFH